MATKGGPAQRAAARASYLQRTYGVTEAQYTSLLARQDGKCAICGSRPKVRRLAVDHDHQTGFVRGLICTKCNRGIACFNDALTRLARAHQYLLDADRWWDTLSEAEQLEWLPFRGRSNGKGRRQRVAKKRPVPRLPQVGGLND